MVVTVKPPTSTHSRGKGTRRTITQLGWGGSRRRTGEQRPAAPRPPHHLRRHGVPRLRKRRTAPGDAGSS